SNVVNSRTFGDAAAACSAAKASQGSTVAKLTAKIKIATARPVTPMILLASHMARLPRWTAPPDPSILSHRYFTTSPQQADAARLTQDSSKFSARVILSYYTRWLLIFGITPDRRQAQSRKFRNRTGSSSPLSQLDRNDRCRRVLVIRECRAERLLTPKS